MRDAHIAPRETTAGFVFTLQDRETDIRLHRDGIKEGRPHELTGGNERVDIQLIGDDGTVANAVPAFAVILGTTLVGAAAVAQVLVGRFAATMIRCLATMAAAIVFCRRGGLGGFAGCFAAIAAGIGGAPQGTRQQADD